MTYRHGVWTSAIFYIWTLICPAVVSALPHGHMVLNDDVFQVQLQGQITERSFEYGAAGRDMEIESNRVWGVLSFRPSYRIGLRLRGGIGDFERPTDFEISPDLAWGGGLTALLWRHEDGLFAVLSSDFAQVQNSEQYVDVGHSTLRNVDVVTREWEGALTVGYEISRLSPWYGSFTPYAGVRYGNADLEETYDVNRSGSWVREKQEADAKEQFGLFAGLNTDLGPLLFMNVEGEFLDQRSISASLGYRWGNFLDYQPEYGPRRPAKDVEKIEISDRVSTPLRGIEELLLHGNAEYAKGEFHAALHYYEEVLERDPRHPRALNNSAVCHYRLQHYEAARLYAQKSVDVAPDDDQAHYNLAMIYYRQGSYADAAASFTRAYTADPTNSRARDYALMMRKKAEKR